MDHLTLFQTILISLLFVWGGFVRSGIGFGSGVLTLPILLLVLHDPIYFIPIMVVQTLFFTSATVLQPYFSSVFGWWRSDGQRENKMIKVDWQMVKKTIAFIAIPNVIGLIGLVHLPTVLLRFIIFGLVSIYAIGFLLNRPIIKSNKKLDPFFLILGGYIHGTSLMGTPLIVAVVSEKTTKEQLRNTLFVLWFALIMIKLATLLYFRVDFHLDKQPWLLSCAMVGHLLGLQLHHFLLQGDSKKFYRLVGIVLLAVSVIGVYQHLA